MKNTLRRALSLMITSVLALTLAGCGASAEGSSRLDQIKKRGVLTVATEPYFAPNEFIDPSKSGNEQYVGSDIELAELIAERIGVKLELVPLEFTQVLASVAEGKYDLAISALAWTPERNEAMELLAVNYRNPSRHNLIERE